jgi:hypothetical protein
MQYYGKNFSPVDPSQQGRLKDLRTWVSQVFTENTVLDTERIVQLASLKESEGREVDLIAKVVSMIRSSADRCEVRLLDASDEIWYTETYMPKLKWLRVG